MPKTPKMRMNMAKKVFMVKCCKAYRQNKVAGLLVHLPRRYEGCCSYSNIITRAELWGEPVRLSCARDGSGRRRRSRQGRATRSRAQPGARLRAGAQIINNGYWYEILRSLKIISSMGSSLGSYLSLRLKP